MRVAPAKKTEALLEVLEKDVAKKNKVQLHLHLHLHLLLHFHLHLHLHLHLQVVIFSNKGSTAAFVQSFLCENNIPCVGFSKQDHYIQRSQQFNFMKKKQKQKLSLVLDHMYNFGP